MKPTLLLTSLPLALVALLACSSGDPEPTFEGPNASQLATDSSVGMLDRDALLQGAVLPSEAAEGPVVDMTGDGYLMRLEPDALLADAEVPRMYGNILTGLAATAIADVVAIAVIGPPAAGIQVAADGQLEQLAPNVWRTTNDVTIDGQVWTAQLTAAWVGVGWVSEMRYSNDTVTEGLWFQGFLAEQGNVGFWDLYRPDGAVAGTVEWSWDGAEGELALSATSGEYNGNSLVFAREADVASITYFDAGTDETSWVWIRDDLWGGVRVPDHNGGVEACWNASYQDDVCP